MIDGLLPELVRLRRELHRRAELSSGEAATAEIVAGWLERLRPDALVRGLGGHGLAAAFDGAEAGETVLLRCELDALPVAETAAAAHRSLDPAVSHACGHDGHMAILAGVGAALSARRPTTGRVVLLFQPAEETGEGAARVLADEKFRPLEPHHVFALHNLPKHPLGEVLVRRGTFSCASVGLAATLEGRTSHAAYPEHGASPAAAVAELLRDLPKLPSSRALRAGYALATVTHARLGEPTFGVAPGEAVVLATLRAESDRHLRRVAEAAEELVRTAAVRRGLGCRVTWEEPFRENRADPDACLVVERAAGAVGRPVVLLPEPIRWCEDFSEFTARYPGAMFGLGSGEAQPQLHNPDYDFPDALIPVGASLFAAIVEEMLG